MLKRAWHIPSKQKKPGLNPGFFSFVLGAGLEPARPQWPLDFKSNVSTNSTIRADPPQQYCGGWTINKKTLTSSVF